jgi:fibronectin-binding autotransporter adhesin
MARLVANVDIITDSFEVWLLQTNELLNAFSTEIITANTTTANTGNSTISRTAQLWGTFGANTIAVSTALRGGNVATGNSANLVITSNATAYVAADAGIRVLAGNSTSNSYLNPVGVYLGLGSANSFVNSSLIITQSSSTVNTNISPSRIQIANSTSTANITPIAFNTGLFVGNTTVVAVGANVYANADTVFVGNSSFDSKFGNGSWSGVANLVITPTNYLTISGAANVTSNANFANTIAVTGNATFSNTIVVTGNAILSNTLIVTGNTTLSNTVDVTGAATLSNTLTVSGLTNAAGNLNTPTANASTAVNVGANVNLTAARINIGNSSVNTAITSTAIDTDGTLDVLGATTLSNTLTVVGLANASGGLNTTTANASSGVNVGANVNLTATRINVGNSSVNTFITSTAIETDGTLTVLGASTLANTLDVAGLASLNAALNTTTANASVAVNVGANVNLTAARISVGNSSVNTFITSTAIETDGTLTVLGAGSLANTLAVTGNTTLSNTLAVTGAANLASTLGVVGAVTLSNTITVTGNATFSNTISVTGLATLGALNATTANATAINVGANVNLTTTRFNVGNSSVNTFITSTAIETDGTLTVLGATSLANTIAVTGNATFSNTLSITGAANALSTLGVAGPATLASSLSVGGATTFQTDYVVDVSANADIGSTVGAVLIYRFPKATYSSAKFEVQVKNGNTQLSELVLAHDGGSAAFVTTYGTVASNGGASPLGTFTANTDTANVNLYLVQTVANSAVKVVAHLIK